MSNITDSLKTWCTVNLDNAAHNYRYTKERTGTKVICVIKANAYGHGAIQIAKRLQEEGCDFFAVSSFEEAMQLREGGIDSSILVLGYILPVNIGKAIENDISFACASYDFAKTLCSLKTNKKARIHIKVNTGMNRTGFNVCHTASGEDFVSSLSLISKSENIIVEGAFTHFAVAECDKEFSTLQAERFLSATEQMKKSGITPEMLHVCNSAGAERYPDYFLDAVRLGIELYGHESDDENYLPVMEFFTRIVDIHKLAPGDGVSYGLDFVAQKETTVAVVGAGYADGLMRCLSHGNGSLLYKGVKCPILGRVCMDMTMIDISGVPEPSVGDVVTIWGKGLSCCEQAKNAKTISYELLCGVAPRVKRVYL